LVRHARARGAEVREGFHVEEVLPPDARGLPGVRGRERASGRRQEVRSRVVIAADGLHSVVARRLGLLVPWRGGPRKIALVAHLRGVGALDAYGEMHVLPGGAYCGIAPLGDGLANVAVVVDEREAPRIKGRRAAYFLDHLARYPALAGRLCGAAIARDVLAVGPLAFRARRYVAGPFALAGDATGFYDPFTGEGIYRAMRAAELLARTVDRALAAPPAALAQHLQAYEPLHRREFAAKRLVEIVVHEVISRPWLFDHVAARLARRKVLADTLVGVTGDFVPPSAVLRPGYLARLIL
jgi:flavin-dependent dehydrogenase